jgi:formamidopyrimidine-DNA glycosylase
MPELPEVETIRRQLEPHLAGRKIVDAAVLDPLWSSPREPREVERALRGARIASLGRRGKYLLLELEGERFLVMHLRMTGNLLCLGAADAEEPSHVRVRLVLDTGERIVFDDVRRFGTGAVIDGRDALEQYLGSRLGPEPLGAEFTAELLGRQASGRRAPVKAFLLDQSRIAGIGNIYADEALFRAEIHPLKPAGRLRRPELVRLRDAIVDTLDAGIAAAGASIDDYRHVDGERGSMQERFLVHLREGEPCPRCGTAVVKLRAAGRGTYICPNCQRAPRRSRARRPARRTAGAST